MEHTYLVSCTTSTQYFQVPITWVIHNICCDFNFDLENKIHRISESINIIWSANDWIWEHNFHTTMQVCCSLSVWNHVLQVLLAFIKNAIWVDISIMNTSHHWTRTLPPNCHLWFDRFECLDTLPRTFGLDPAEGVWQFWWVYVNNL
jgi:hypothetical protein